MTGDRPDDEESRQHRKRAFILDRLAKWAMDWALVAIAAIILALFTPYWSQVKAVWDTPRKMEEMFARLEARQAEVSAAVADLRDGVMRATGDDRVIRQPSGSSYVEEPVRRGDNVVLWLTVARTRLGKDCRLMDWTPLFTDAQNVPFAGSRPNRGVRRQITDDYEKLRVEIIPPESLLPGRIELYLSLDYECDGKRVPDHTDVVTYRLLGDDR